ncbi:WAT1-related protein At1g68170 [Linum grandiflorum]
MGKTGKTTCKEKIEGLKPAFLMVLVQISLAVVNIFYKLAANDGMILKIIVAYRFLFASAFMVPLAILFERNNQPRFSWKILVHAFLCGLFGGSLSQNLYLESLAYTSATFASAMANLVPAITFILAVSFRLEKVRLGSTGGKAKLLGTVIGVGGAMLLTFYKGAIVEVWTTHVNLLKKTPHSANSGNALHQQNRGIGSLFAIGSCFSYALWLIVQAKMGEVYPCPYSATALMCIMGSIQAAFYALCSERDSSQWKLGWNVRLLTVAYSGIVASGPMVTVIGWCVKKRGPLFVSAFNPLMLVCVAIASSLLLDEKLYVGSLLGSILIICGLYGVIWGKGKEIKKMEKEQEQQQQQLASMVMMAAGATLSNIVPTATDIFSDDQPQDCTAVIVSNGTMDNKDDGIQPAN